MTPGSDDDHDLIERVAKGDRSAFGTLFDRHAGAASRYAMRLLGDRAASEDAVHGAFARLLESARGGRIDPERGTLRGLLFRTVRNLSIDWLRSRARDVPLPAREPEQPPPADTGEVRLELEAALALLPENHRSALLLRVDGGLTYAEIGVALAATPSQVKMWIFRARRALAGRMLEPCRATEVGRVV